MCGFRVTSAAALSALLLASAPIRAASDYFLEISGIEGESTAGSRPEVIEVTSFSWGASNPVSVAGKTSSQVPSAAQTAPAREAGTGLATGKRTAAADGAAAAPTQGAVNELVLLVRESPSKASTGLTRMCATGKHIKNGVLTGQGKRYELENVIVSSCTVKAGQREVRLKGHVTLIK